MRVEGAIDLAKGFPHKERRENCQRQLPEQLSHWELHLVWGSGFKHRSWTRSIRVRHSEIASFRGRDPVFIGRVDARDTRAGHTAREEWRHASLPRFRILGSQLPEKLAYW